MTKITVILPAYNEEVSIGSIVIGAKKHADNVIVIDDGSNDNTAEIAELAGANVIKHSSNQGKGAALKTGFKSVGDTDIIVTMDSDGQHKPEDIKKLVSPIENGEADVVNGSRYLNRKKSDTPAYRRIGQTVLDKATNVGSGLDVTDSQSGFRAFASHTIPAFRFSSSNFGIESEMLMDASNAGLRIKEVEIGVRYDVNSSTKGPVSHGLEVLMKIINEIEFKRPLYYFTLPGINNNHHGTGFRIQLLWRVSGKNNHKHCTHNSCNSSNLLRRIFSSYWNNFGFNVPYVFQINPKIS